ncbi:MAG: hypothetical protein AB7V43_11765 [Acidimicrobiia bacterium]
MERIQPVSAIRPAVIDLRDDASARLRLASYRRSPRPSAARDGKANHPDSALASGDAWVELDGWAPPGPREIEAARTLGVSTEASQAEIDARFRQIVRSQRPDLGEMSPEALATVLSARRLLSQRSRQANAPTQPTLYGNGAQRSGRFIDLDA